jgi:hypothetical protein
MEKRGVGKFIVVMVIIMCGLTSAVPVQAQKLVGLVEVKETTATTALVSSSFAFMMAPREKGFCWSKQQTPKPSLSNALGTTKSVQTEGSYFTATLTGLDPETTYYLVSYAVSSDGSYTSYSDETVPFTTGVPGPAAAFDPEDGAVNVLPDTNITITFEEPVRLRDDSAVTNDNVDALITFKKGSASGADVGFDATINAEKTVITINPTDILTGGQRYYAAIGADFEGNSGNAVDPASITFTPATGGVYTITATAGTNGSISPSGSVTVTEDGSQNFTITPAEGYAVDDVLVDDVSVGPRMSYLFQNVTQNHTIRVTFKEGAVQHTITPTAGENGSIDPSAPVLVDDGQDRIFTMTPASGYVLDDVTVDGESVKADVINNSYTFVNVTSDHTIHATFKVSTGDKQYTISATAGLNGIINPSGDVLVPEGVNWTFQMKPAAGYVVDDVTVDEVSVLDKVKNNIYTFTNVTSNHTIHVTFKMVDTEKQYTITATSGPNGSIDPLGEIVLKEGGEQFFTMYMAVGYVVQDVLIDGKSVGPVTRYIFSSVTEDHTIHVTFKRSGKKYTITATSGANGTISPLGTIVVNEGDSQKFTMQPNTGYKVKNVMVNDVSAGGPSTYTFPSVTSDHEIHVTFMETPMGDCVPGDANGNQRIDLEDVIFNLQVLSGMRE